MDYNLTKEMSVWMRQDQSSLVLMLLVMVLVIVDTLLAIALCNALAPKLNLALNRQKGSGLEHNAKSKRQPCKKVSTETPVYDRAEEDERKNEIDSPTRSIEDDAEVEISKVNEHDMLNSATQMHNWYCVGASVRGVGHIITDVECQDFHLYSHLPSGELLVAVADGVGMAKQAKTGAEIACHTAIDFLSDNLFLQPCSPLDETAEQILSKSFEQARMAIVAHAEKSAIPVKDYATTLILVILASDSLLGGMVGDGMVVVESAGEFSCLFDLHKHKYANQIVPVTSSRSIDFLQISSVSEPIQSVSILTDGLLGMSCDLRSLKPYPQFFQMMLPLLEKVPDHEKAKNELQVLLDHPLINEKSDDDKTLVMAKSTQVEQE